MRVAAEVDEVELGRAFPLTVVRIWNLQQEKPEWSDRLLEPLVVYLLETTQRQNETVVEETRRYRAYAFSDLSEPIELRVRRTLDPEKPGPAELPLLPEDRPFPWWLIGAAGALLSVALVAVVARMRAQRIDAPPPAVESSDLPGPEVAALQRLAQLRGRAPQGRGETRVFFVEVSSIVREYAAARFSVTATEMTTEELTSHLTQASLAACLGHCDRVKFARHLPGPVERDRTLDHAEAFVREAAR